jgi:SpoVK/Ycf46/Vps4 family AAA+-type ATPase
MVSEGGGQGTHHTPPSTKPLHWEAFAGYDDVLVRLKRLLLTSAKLHDARTETEVEVAAIKSATKSEHKSGIEQPSTSLLQLVSIPRGLLLHGPSGCGKSLLAKIIASELSMELIIARPAEVLSRYFGQTEKNVRALFQSARGSAPCVLFFDDIDCLVSRRRLQDDEGGGDDSVGDEASSTRTLATLLDEIDGISSNNNHTGSGSGSCSGSGSGTYGRGPSVLVIAACANMANIDEALLRPGRLQHHIQLGLPSSIDARAIWARRAEGTGTSTHKSQSRDVAVAPPVPPYPSYVVEALDRDGLTCADVGALVDESLFCEAAERCRVKV